jgi:hypothetical protein
MSAGIPKTWAGVEIKILNGLGSGDWGGQEISSLL